MRRISGLIITNLILVGVCYASYQLLLTDEAKQSLKDGVGSIVKGVVATLDAIEEMRGVVMDDDQPLPNVAATNAEWDALGL